MLLNRWDLVAATLLIRRRKKKEASVYVRNCSEASSHIARKGHFLRFFFSNSHRVNRCTASCAFIIIVFFFSQMRTTHTLFHCPFFSLFFFFLSPLLRLCSASPFFFSREVFGRSTHIHTSCCVSRCLLHLFFFFFRSALRTNTLIAQFNRIT